MNMAINSVLLAIAIAVVIFGLSSMNRQTQRSVRKSEIETLLESRLVNLRAKIKQSTPSDFLTTYASTNNKLFNPQIDKDLMSPTVFAGVFGISPSETLDFNGRQFKLDYVISLRKANSVFPYQELDCAQACKLNEVAYIYLSAKATLQSEPDSGKLGGFSEAFISI